MITELRLVNFRNFEQLKLNGLSKQNFLVWENGKWKTNILESISLLSNNSITWLSYDELVKRWEDYFFIEYLSDDWNKVSFSYTKEKKKKQFMLNNNKISKKKFNQITNKCVIFSPIIMNLMYLSPNLRRSFLDDLLKSSFDEYEELLTNYKKIIKHRNKTLKNILDWKSNIEEIKFWNEKFIEQASKIYKYRFKIINFLKSTIETTKEFFSWKVEKIEFIYNTKVSENTIEEDIRSYLEKNIDRDIILCRTPIWPHIDDFEILVDWIHLSHFASRWETKSMILWLKLLEWIFIEKMTGKKPILLIDDLLSELDNNHKDMLLKKIEYYQTFISSITKTDGENIIIT